MGRTIDLICSSNTLKFMVHIEECFRNIGVDINEYTWDYDIFENKVSIYDPMLVFATCTYNLIEAYLKAELLSGDIQDYRVNIFLDYTGPESVEIIYKGEKPCIAQFTKFYKDTLIPIFNNKII